MNTNQDFEQRLAESIKRVAQKRKQLRQPKLTPHQLTAVDQAVRGCANRLVKTLFKRQGIRSDDLCIEVDIRNLSHAVMKSKSALAEIGLAIHCTMEPTRTRFDKTKVIGVWWLRVIDADRWQAASDKAADKAADKRLAA